MYTGNLELGGLGPEMEKPQHPGNAAEQGTRAITYR